MAEPTLSARTPSLRERIVDQIARVLGDNKDATALAEQLTSAAEFSPLGLMTGAYDVGRSGAETAGAPSLSGVATTGLAAAGILPWARGVGRTASRALDRSIAREAAFAARPTWQTPAVEPKGILAYHGSRADFPAFSDEFIGTGEGAQAYGHGHYLAGAEPTAEAYRTKLAGSHQKVRLGDTEYLPFKTHDLAGRPYPEGQSPPGRERLEEALVRDYGLTPDNAKMVGREIEDKSGDIGRARRFLTRATSQESPMRKVLDLMESKKVGHQYEVQIHADPEKFLNWDAPLSEQPEAVRKAAPSVFSLGEQLGSGTGEDVYRSLASDYGKEIASRKLKEAGVPGIKYFDQLSRGAGEGSRNYAVFDPDMISILRKYGILPAAYGAYKAQQGEDAVPPTSY